MPDSNSKKIFTRKRIILLSALLLVLAIAGIALTFKTPEMVKLGKTKVKRLEGKIMYVEAEVVIHNANFYPISIQSFENKIFINNEQAAIAKRKEKITLAAQANTTLTLEVELDIKALAQIHPKLKQQKMCAIDMKGDYKLNALVGAVNFNANNHQEIDLSKQGDQIANFTIGKDGLKVKGLKTKASDKGMDISLNIGLQNKYPFDYKINTLDVNITPPDNEAKLGRWTLSESKVIRAHTTEYLPVQFYIPSNKLIAALSIMYAKKVQAIGSCQVVVADEVFNIPIKQSIPLPAHQLVGSQF